MQREFDELGVMIAGRSYGSFSGTAMWTFDGDLDCIIIEPQSATAPTVRLDYDALFRGHTTPDNMLHPTDKQMLWSLLADAIAARFEDDVKRLRAESLMDRAERIYGGAT